MRVSVEFIGLAFFIYLFAIERNLHCPCMSIWNLYSILSNVREKEIFFVRFVLLLLLLFIVVVVDSPLVTINLIINFPSHSLQSCNIFARYLFAMLRFRRFFLFSFCFLLLSSIFSVICVNGQSWIAQTFKHTHMHTYTSKSVQIERWIESHTLVPFPKTKANEMKDETNSMATVRMILMCLFV